MRNTNSKKDSLAALLEAQNPNKNTVSKLRYVGFVMMIFSKQYIA